MVEPKIGDHLTLGDYWKGHRLYGKVFQIARIDNDIWGRPVWYDVETNSQYNLNMCWNRVDVGGPW